ALWQEATSVFEAAGYRVRETGTKHGTITVIIDGHAVEVTTYRVDGSYTDARHPDSVEFVRDIHADLDRRDFTVNAMAYHPERGLLDPHGGRLDCATKTLRAVGDPATRFKEDALRILRACRFSSQLDFTIEPTTLRAMEVHANLINSVAAERITHELTEFICGPSIHDALLTCVNVLVPLMPELATMNNFDQRTPYHIYDVLEHTAYVMQNTPPYPLVRWAALFHDMGKPRAFFVDDAGIGHFYGHAKISVELALPILKRLKISRPMIEEITLLVTYHDDVIEPNPKAIKRMLRRLNDSVSLFKAMCDLKRGDALAQAPHCHGRVTLADDLETMLNTLIEANEAFSLKDLAINGNDLIALGISPGPKIGALLEAALNAVIDERVENEHDALLLFLQKQ
ncbi:MAG: HD domain-containing protein, partial [Raoultibacter sp.]